MERYNHEVSNLPEKGAEVPVRGRRRPRKTRMFGRNRVQPGRIWARSPATATHPGKVTVIEGQRIRLWALEKFDISRNYQWGNDPELAFLTGMNPFPKSLVDIERWFETVCVNQCLKLFTIKTLSGEYIGNVEISELEWRTGCGEIGIIIGEKEFWHQGYGREAIGLLADFAFREMRLHRLEARVLAHNVRAQRVFERCGFVREGVMRDQFFLQGRHVDVIGFGLLASDPRPPREVFPDEARSESPKESLS